MQQMKPPTDTEIFLFSGIVLAALYLFRPRYRRLPTFRFAAPLEA